jgi:hypothetical protein
VLRKQISQVYIRRHDYHLTVRHYRENRALLPPFRNLVFVGHRIHNDIQTLRVLDFRFSRSLAYILDTDSVVKNVLGTWHGSLGALLQKMDSLFDKLHCAGSDANFTLRALLLLAAQGFIEQVPKQADKSNTVAILSRSHQFQYLTGRGYELEYCRSKGTSRSKPLRGRRGRQAECESCP